MTICPRRRVLRYREFRRGDRPRLADSGAALRKSEVEAYLEADGLAVELAEEPHTDWLYTSSDQPEFAATGAPAVDTIGCDGLGLTKMERSVASEVRCIGIDVGQQYKAL